jgi:adenylylsulfate kinase-like enzyme
MRLLITGKARSGKSTTLHQLLSDLLRRPWIKALLLDGKGG